MWKMLAAAILAAVPTMVQAEKVVITADRYLDVQTGRYVEHPAIFIGDDGRISSIADARTVRWGADVRQVDLAGKTLVPGLIDMHARLIGLAAIDGSVVDGFAGAKKALRAGFTTVLNFGLHDIHDVALKEAIDGGAIAGPHIVPAYVISATGGHCDNGVIFVYNRPSIDSSAQRRQEVGWLHQSGAGVIQICATGGEQQLSMKEMKAIVDEAHMLHIKVAAHVDDDKAIRDAILAGADIIEHAMFASFGSARMIKLAARHKTWFSMDANGYILVTRTANGSLYNEYAISRKQQQTFERAVQAGVPMVFGSGAGLSGNGKLAEMVERGMTPLQAIQAATRNAAEALGRTEDIGAVEVGRYGDLVAVTGDPTQNIHLLERPDAVIKGGALVAP